MMSYSNKYDANTYLSHARTHARSLCVHPNFQATTRATSDNFVACRSRCRSLCVHTLWVGRRKEPILSYVPKSDEKKNPGTNGLNRHFIYSPVTAPWDILPRPTAPGYLASFVYFANKSRDYSRSLLAVLLASFLF